MTRKSNHVCEPPIVSRAMNELSITVLLKGGLLERPFDAHAQGGEGNGQTARYTGDVTLQKTCTLKLAASLQQQPDLADVKACRAMPNPRVVNRATAARIAEGRLRCPTVAEPDTR